MVSGLHPQARGNPYGRSLVRETALGTSATVEDVVRLRLWCYTIVAACRCTDLVTSISPRFTSIRELQSLRNRSLGKSSEEDEM